MNIPIKELVQPMNHPGFCKTHTEAGVEAGESAIPLPPCEYFTKRESLCTLCPVYIAALQRCNIQIVYSDEMLRPCETKCNKAREIGVGGVSSPLSDNIIAKLF